MAQELRLDKYLADMGKGTRSQIKEAIRKGRVRIGNEIVKKPETKVRIPEDTVLLDGEAVSYVELEYYMLNKPAGVVSATEDKKYKTVIDLIDERSRKDLFPVGRLDIDTEGLLLITNDGDMAHRLLSPKRHVDKIYYALCKGRVPETATEAFAKGLLLPDGLLCLPAKLEILSHETNETGEPQTNIRLTIREGKFHQVKRMMEAVECPVLKLKRLSMGPIRLDPELKPGEYRKLNEEELELLKEIG